MAYFQTTDWAAKLRLITDLETHKQEQAQNLKQKIRDTKQAMAGNIAPGPGGSPGQPYQPPQPTGPYTRPKTEGEKLRESGEYLKDPETEVDTSQPLEIKGGMPPAINSDAWDPKKERRKQRIRDLKQGNTNPNERRAAEQKQTPTERVDIPDWLQHAAPKVRDSLMLLGPAIWQMLNPLQGQMAELNPAQIKALEGIPKDIKNWPSDKRLNKMREITTKVNNLG